MKELNARICIDGDLNEAIIILDENFIDNDIDNGNRLMVAEENLDDAISVLEYNGFNCDII